MWHLLSPWVIFIFNQISQQLIALYFDPATHVASFQPIIPGSSPKLTDVIPLNKGVPTDLITQVARILYYLFIHISFCCFGNFLGRSILGQTTLGDQVLKGPQRTSITSTFYRIYLIS